MILELFSFLTTPLLRNTTLVLVLVLVSALINFPEPIIIIADLVTNRDKLFIMYT